jgi:hypothetical protein
MHFSSLPYVSFLGQAFISDFSGSVYILIINNTWSPPTGRIDLNAFKTMKGSDIRVIRDTPCDVK